MHNKATTFTGLLLASVAAVAVSPLPRGQAGAAPATAAIGPSSGITTTALFGSSALVLDAGQLNRWQAVKDRHRSQSESREWRSLVSKARVHSTKSILERVNRLVNEVPPVRDARDEWKTPTEFLRSGGDCEEYAITKLLLLHELGVPVSSMRVLALHARPGIPAHAVLVVDTSKGPTVLDNMRSRTYGLGQGVTSRMAYAFNESSWWVAVGGGGSLLATSQ